MSAKEEEVFVFKPDGSYTYLPPGSLIVNAASWNISDWSEVENCLDSERTFIVRGLIGKYGEERVFA